MMDKKLVLAGETTRPGQRNVTRVPVTADLNGAQVAVWVHTLVGEEPGPTLTVLSTLHGCEWQSIEVVRRLITAVSPSNMRGALVAIPVGNPVAFGDLTRNTRDESDSPDLNRSFPGKYTWIAEQIAGRIVQEVFAVSDYLIDFHFGNWGVFMGEVLYGQDFPDKEVVERSKQLAKAFGYPCVQKANICTEFPGPKSATGYAGASMGIPSIAVELGGAGFARELEEQWIRANLTGVTNVMKHLGMLPGEPDLPDKYLLWEKRWRVNPSIGGYLHPVAEADQMIMKEVESGETLGKVISPYTFEELESLDSPGPGIVFYTARSYPVRPGEWAFGVIRLDHPGTRWVRASEF